MNESTIRGMGKHVAEAFDKANRTHLARETGMDRSHVSQVLNGTNVPSLVKAAKLANGLGVTLDDFHAQWLMRAEGKGLAAVAA